MMYFPHLSLRTLCETTLSAVKQMLGGLSLFVYE